MIAISEEQADADDEGSDSEPDDGDLGSRAAAAFLGIAFSTTSATSTIIPADLAAATATGSQRLSPHSTETTAANAAGHITVTNLGIISEDETSSRKSLSPTAAAAAAAAVFSVPSDESDRNERSGHPIRSRSNSLSPTAAASAAAAAFSLLSDDSDSGMESCSERSTSPLGMAAAAAAAFSIPSDSDDNESPQRPLSPLATAAAAAAAFTLDSDGSDKGEGTSFRHSLSPWAGPAVAGAIAHNNIITARENSASDMESDALESDSDAPVPANDIDPRSFTLVPFPSNNIDPVSFRLYIPDDGPYTAEHFRHVPDDFIE